MLILMHTQRQANRNMEVKELALHVLISSLG